MPTVHSRAYLLIEQQLRHFEQQAEPGIQLYPTYSGNLFTLSAKIKGVKDTLWDGAVLKLRLNFSENFNYTQPEAHFITVPFHPNVSPDTGRVSCPLLDDPQKWNASITLSSVLSSIRAQLSSPDSRLVLNSEAADMMSSRPDQYRKIVSQCVRNSQMVENSPDSCESPVDPGACRQRVTIEYDQEFLDRPSTRPQPPAQKKISFEEYRLQWSQLATSKTPQTGPFQPESHWTDPQVLSAKLKEHRLLKYGTVNATAEQRRSEKQENLQRVDQMRRLYLSQKQASCLSARGAEVSLEAGGGGGGGGDGGQYPEEAEVDELMRWTSGLPADGH